MYLWKRLFRGQTSFNFIVTLVLLFCHIDTEWFELFFYDTIFNPYLIISIIVLFFCERRQWTNLQHDHKINVNSLLTILLCSAQYSGKWLIEFSTKIFDVQLFIPRVSKLWHQLPLGVFWSPPDLYSFKIQINVFPHSSVLASMLH